MVADASGDGPVAAGVGRTREATTRMKNEGRGNLVFGDLEL